MSPFHGEKVRFCAACSTNCHVTVLGQNGSRENGTTKMVADKMVCGQNGIGQMVRTKWYADKMVLTKWYG